MLLVMVSISLMPSKHESFEVGTKYEKFIHNRDRCLRDIPLGTGTHLSHRYINLSLSDITEMLDTLTSSAHSTMYFHHHLMSANVIYPLNSHHALF